MTRRAGRLAILLLAVLLTVTASGASAQQTPPIETARQLLQRAVHLEEAMGEPEAAIAAYEKVIEAADADAPLTAVAEFRMAMLLAATGRVDEARAHHLRITQAYADDPDLAEIVDLARTALGDAARSRAGRSMVARRLWEGSAGYAFGALSPDGSFISYVDWGSGALAIHDLDRGVERQVTDLSGVLRNDAWSSSVVSPDNERVAYTWYSPETGYEIRTARLDGSDNRTLLSGWTRPRHVELEGWSSDGRDLLAIVFVDETTHDLALIDTRNGTIHTVAQLGSWAPEIARLSPNGRWIAYHQLNADGTHDVVLAASDGSTITTLVDHPANDLMPIWTADGNHVLFVSDRSGTLGAWVIAVSPQGLPDGEAQLVKPDFGRSVPMGFTGDGALIYARQVSTNDIFTAPMNPGEDTLGQRMSLGGQLVGVNRLPQISADGRRMFYLSEPGLMPLGVGPKTLTIRDVESGREQTLSPTLRRIMSPRWHPDGRTLVAEALGKDGRWGIYLIDAETSASRLLVGWNVNACGCSAAPVISSDGAALAYFRPSGTGELGGLVVRHLVSRAEVTLVDRILPDDVIDMDFTPDGRHLATAIRPRSRGRSDGWRLQFLDVATARAIDITSLGTEPESLGLSGWTDGGQGLLFVRAEENRHSLGWVSADGEGLAWLILDLPADMREVRLHPRYERLVFTAGDYRAEVWMLEDPLGALQRP